MTVDLHLFSSPGENDARYIIEAARPYLEGRPEAVVAYMPLASLFAERWQAQNARKDVSASTHAGPMEALQAAVAAADPADRIVVFGSFS